MNLKLYLIIALIAAPVVGWMSVPYWTEREITATVKDKARIVEGDRSYYLIFTDQTVLRNSDSIIRFKFDSSTVYGALDKGQTYQFTIYGWRFPFLSWYPNILNYTER